MTRRGRPSAGPAPPFASFRSPPEPCRSVSGFTEPARPARCRPSACSALGRTHPCAGNSPDVYAGLARTIRRWQAAGEPKPHVAPLDGRHRLPVDLGLIATALTGLLNKALGDWPDTG
ncbi:MAG: hypothetical protein R3C04_08120 [Hyphomonas sp.]